MLPTCSGGVGLVQIPWQKKEVRFSFVILCIAIYCSIKCAPGRLLNYTGKTTSLRMMYTGASWYCQKTVKPVVIKTVYVGTFPNSNYIVRTRQNKTTIKILYLTTVDFNALNYTINT